MTSITTYTRKNFDPISPDIELIDIADIAHALSFLCRANGHLPEFYSVGMHSLNCMAEAQARGYSMRICLICLLHDASEAYLSDVTRPVKSVMPLYREIENKLQNVIYKKWLGNTLSDKEYRIMREIDDAILECEMRRYFGENTCEQKHNVLSSPNFDFESFAKTEKDFTENFERLCKVQ